MISIVNVLLILLLKLEFIRMHVQTLLNYYEIGLIQRKKANRYEIATKYIIRNAIVLCIS